MPPFSGQPLKGTHLEQAKVGYAAGRASNCACPMSGVDCQLMPSDDSTENRPLIDWTGERCGPWASDIQVIYERYHRYVFAAPLVAGRTVLELASGEGYGAALLATQARTVVGIDIDDATVEHSRRTYQLDNLEFRHGDMLDLAGFSDDSFDVVVCFEAIEHIEDHHQLMAEATRVLGPDGLFLVSTLDRLINTDYLERVNAFHAHELSRDELADLLGRSFAHQRTWPRAPSPVASSSPWNQMQDRERL